MRWLREKVELDPGRPALLVTKRGVGYMLVMPELELEAEDPSELEAD